jgi:hypothetical protein
MLLKYFFRSVPQVSRHSFLAESGLEIHHVSKKETRFVTKIYKEGQFGLEIAEDTSASFSNCFDFFLSLAGH